MSAVNTIVEQFNVLEDLRSGLVSCLEITAVNDLVFLAN